MPGRTFVLALVGAVFLTLTALVALPVLALRPAPLNPATPPLLRGVTAASGWDNDGCPRLTDSTLVPGREALSPDLTARLVQAFRPGREADRLETTLCVQGFRPMDPCEADPTIRRAVFVQSGGGLAGPYPVTALPAWKRSADGGIVWTKGFVRYLAP